jgi:DNA replicative helicase MCM subunit Mcm2 (Cdc46/Mcm family)
MFEDEDEDGDQNTYANSSIMDWHNNTEPGKLCGPHQNIDEQEYLQAFTKVLVESFKEEILQLLRLDTVMDRQANRWDDDSDAGTPYKSGGGSLMRGDDSGDEVSASQEEQQQRKEKYYGLEISHRLLCDASPLLAHIVIHALQSHVEDDDDMLTSIPEKVWGSFDGAVLAAQQDLYERELQMAAEMNYGSETSRVADTLANEFSVKHNVNVRLVDLCGGLRKPNVSSIRSFDVGSFVELGGTVTRTGIVKMVESERYYVCDAERCAFEFSVHANVDRAYGIDEPKGCPQQTCKSFRCNPIPEKSVCRDCQELRLQEHATKLAVGSIPRSILVVLEDDLVDKCKAGDDVTITGVVRRRWKPLVRDRKMELELYILAKSMRITTKTSGVDLTEDLRREFEDFWELAEKTNRANTFRNHIVASVCPQMHGLYAVKMAVLLTLIGGVGRESKGHRIRGQSHLLLIGDPGTGKSQFLRYAAKLSPRSVMTTGIGSTSAGLTCTAVRDGGEWMLEAGALVLADRGLCCIDEFSTIRENDRATIHEAMEQQTLSVAKAGLVCKLNTRTTIIAATNPKGKYDEEESVSTNTAIASPLLSRFDLAFVMLDRPNPSRDCVLSTFVLNSHLHAMEKCLRPSNETSRGNGDRSEYGGYVDDNGNGASAEAEARGGDEDGGVRRSRGKVLTMDDWIDTMSNHPTMDIETHEYESIVADCNRALEQTWSIPKMQAYIAWIQDTCTPEIGEQASEILQKYYLYQRKTDDRNASRTTVRLLESLIRIAQAHARLMHENKVCVDDAIIAVQLVDASMSNSSILGSGNTPMAVFPEDADVTMNTLRTKILNILQIQCDGDYDDDHEDDCDGEDYSQKNRRSSQASNSSISSRWSDGVPQTTHHIESMNRYSEGGIERGSFSVEKKRRRNKQGTTRSEDDDDYFEGRDPLQAALSQASGYGEYVDADNHHGNSGSGDGGSRSGGSSSSRAKKRSKKNMFE